MKLTEKIINIALLGTSNRKLERVDLPDFIQSQLPEPSENQDYEDYFFKVSSLTFGCENSGLLPQKIDSTFFMKPFEPDSSPYIDNNKISLLIYLVDSGLRLLLNYGFYYLRACRMLLPPFALPYFVARAFNFSDKYVYQYRLAVWSLIGNRGKWLVENADFPSEKWSNSSHSRRLKMFVALRKAGLNSSSKYLSDNWLTLSPKQKSDFLSVWGRVLDSDLDFLQNAFDTETSPKIKQLLLKLLLQNENSSIVKQDIQFLENIIKFDGKKSIDFSEIEFSEDLQQRGLSVVNTENNNLPTFFERLSDSEKLVFQLIHRMPFSFWQKFTGFDAKNTNQFLLENPSFKFGFNFLDVIKNFRDKNWAFEYCKYNSIIYQCFMPFLDADSLEILSEYCDFDFDFFFSEKLCGNFDNFQVWKDNFSLKILKFIINKRNFSNTILSAQFAAIKLSANMEHFIYVYICEHEDNDIVSTFFRRLHEYRKYLKQLTA
ncbi:MAG: hypothetical protein IKQ46_16130 [Bacteroidales bacterium]|nr:hypothetical protein [Bacteroidales bacterium]